MYIFSLTLCWYPGPLDYPLLHRVVFTYSSSCWQVDKKVRRWQYRWDTGVWGPGVGGVETGDVGINRVEFILRTYNTPVRLLKESRILFTLLGGTVRDLRRDVWSVPLPNWTFSLMLSHTFSSPQWTDGTVKTRRRVEGPRSMSSTKV